jgi:putative N6-adenine-specific DNA methylase
MLDYNKPNTITVTCHKWLAPYLQQEIESLGYTNSHQFATGVSLQGTLNDCIKLNMHLRCASQVLYLIKDFYCNHPDDLYKQASQIKWQNIIPDDGFISISSNVFHPTINNNLFANVRVKDAIVDVLQKVNGKRPNSGNTMEQTVIHLHWKGDTASIFIDTSGQSLGRHGYRKIPGKAPMLEALAAATIIATQWQPNTTFINPMCGSGTVAIEAALIATNRKPGLLRKKYGFMHIKGYNDAFYTNELQQLFNNITPATCSIIASDISADAIKIAKINADNADVEDVIDWQLCDFAATTVPSTIGTIFLNPEYGERLGEETTLEETYKRIGDFFKQQCAGYAGFIFTGNLDLAKKIGLKPKRRIEFLNGKIDCRLLSYELYAGSKETKTEIQ